MANVMYIDDYMKDGALQITSILADIMKQLPDANTHGSDKIAFRVPAKSSPVPVKPTDTLTLFSDGPAFIQPGKEFWFKTTYLSTWRKIWAFTHTVDL